MVAEQTHHHLIMVPGSKWTVTVTTNLHREKARKKADISKISPVYVLIRRKS